MTGANLTYTLGSGQLYLKIQHMTTHELTATVHSGSLPINKNIAQRR